jgi:hypothetical protein
LYIYVELKVEIRRGREGKHGHRVTVECEKSDGGRVGPTDAQPITSSVRRLMPATSAEQRIDLGEELGQCMFPPRVLATFTETLRGLDAGTGIRVRLPCMDEEMARPGYLFRDERFSLVRTVIDHRSVVQPEERRNLVILTVDATKAVDDQELEPDFPEQLAHAVPLRRLDLTHTTRRTIDELIDQVVDGEDPLDIFHFTGHGQPPRDGQAGGYVVLYSRASSGRFLEPMPTAAEPPRAATDGGRRWAMMGGARGHRQVILGEAGPELRQVEDATKADISHLRRVHASLALSGDARVVAQVNRGRLALAWVDRVRPRLDRWPESFELALDAQEIRLLAVAVDYGDEVVRVLSTDRATYRVDVARKARPAVTPIFSAPTRHATILAGQVDTVDSGGRLRGWELNQDRYGIAETGPADSLVARRGAAADEVVVVRPLSGTHAPAEILLSNDGHIERVAADGGS